MPEVTPLPDSIGTTPPETHARVVLSVIMFLGLVLYGSLLGWLGGSLRSTARQLFGNSNTGLIEQIGLITQTTSKPLKGEENDRINVLILGYGGKHHPGGGLTDTMLVASLKPSTHQVAMISLPRDLVVNYGGKQPEQQEWRKINNAFSEGGVELAQEKVEDVLGLKIHYSLTVDFDGFKQVIDHLGGVSVYVPNAFTDRQYPDYNYGYQTITFKEGWNTFDGERALQYARSRHGNNGEGSDFARSQRQQIIIQAVKDTVLSANTLLNPIKLNNLLTDVGEHVHTSAEVWELVRLADMARNVGSEDIHHVTIDDSANGLLKSEIVPETGAYILMPRAGLGKFADIKKAAKTVFEVAATEAAAQAQATTKPPAGVAIQNGTTIAGLGRQLADLLPESEFTVADVSNATVRNQAATVLFDLTGGTKPEARDALASLAHVSASNIHVVVADALDATLVNTAALPPQTEFLIVLGADQQTAESDAAAE